MDIFESMQNAWKVIVRNKMRSFLTMLGIIIGITAVIIVLSVGESVQGLILNEVKSIGSNLIGILPGHAEEDGPPSAAFGVVITTLKYEDGEAILNSGYEHIESLAMYVSGSDIISLNDKKFQVYNYFSDNKSSIICFDYLNKFKPINYNGLIKFSTLKNLKRKVKTILTFS